MKQFNPDDLILRFCRDDIGGLLVTNEGGAVVYADAKSACIRLCDTNWQAACPPACKGQKAEMWDLQVKDSGKSYMVTTSSVLHENGLLQIHQLIDVSLYMEMYREINHYSKFLKQEKEHDSLTGLYNKGKFMSLKRSLFRHQNAIAIFNLDVNHLKTLNDTYGHEAGDRLIKKAAESLKKIEARNVMPFRVGGDEFIVAALHVSREEAEQIKQTWEKGLEELNQNGDGIECVIACGFVYGEAGYDLDALLDQADQLMYEDKQKKKQQRAGH